jgi:Ser/Thr protein kinase RdoA (MazF antagonist)
LRRDIEVSGYLAGCDVPAVRPCADPPAGPHHHDGLALAFFEFVPHDPEYKPDPARIARMLAELHEALRDYPGELPADGPVADLGRAFDLLEREAVLATGELRAELAELSVAVAGLPGQALHGDAHPANLLATPDGLVWNDFEDTWRGPVAWDLACLLNTKQLDGRAAVAAYPSAPPAEEIDLFLRLRRLYTACWPALVAWAQRVHGLGSTAY